MTSTPAVKELVRRWYGEAAVFTKPESDHTALADHDGVWECSFVGACSEVCPKSVDPASALQQMKLDGAKAWWKQILPGGKS